MSVEEGGLVGFEMVSVSFRESSFSGIPKWLQEIYVASQGASEGFHINFKEVEAISRVTQEIQVYL